MNSSTRSPLPTKDRSKSDFDERAPVVSILIPAYNAARWLAQTLDSALSQTWSDKEVVVVDDGSTDDTLRVAKGYARRGVRVIAQPNLGASAARNTALKVARGSYVQFLDADDLLHPEKLARQLEGAGDGRTSRTLLTGAWGRFFVRPDRATFTPDPLWHDLAPVDWMLAKFNHNRFMFPASWLVSRQLIDAAGPWNEALSLDDDGEYLSRLVVASQRVHFVPEAKSYYRVGNANSLSCQRSARAVHSGFTSMSLSIDHFLTFENSESTRNACVKLLQDNLHLYYPEHDDLVKRCGELARQLGTELVTPTEGRHFRLFRHLFGWKLARQARCSLNRLKLRIHSARDRLPVPGTGRLV